GDYVMFCPPGEDVFVEARKRGYLSPGQCDGNFSQMMKKILAAKNDRVSVTKNGVYINSKLIPFSKPIAKDGTNRPMPVFRVEDYQLKDDELLLMGEDNPISWDGRYYGLVKVTQIRTVVYPVYIY
ncbi:MAG: conjugative transfer signal peptidase TraF, partial [Xanthomonadales bacterium]|nr:conjugative transfer signal peptidase TraF [Xanthomonadales bacterium]